MTLLAEPQLTATGANPQDKHSLTWVCKCQKHVGTMQDLLYKQHCKNSPEHCRSTCSTHCTRAEVFGNVTAMDPREGGEMGRCFPSLLPAPCITLKGIMLGWRRRTVCCSLRSSQPPRTCRINCLFLLENIQVVLGIQHGLGCRGAGRVGPSPLDGHKNHCRLWETQD